MLWVEYAKKGVVWWCHINNDVVIDALSWIW